MAFSPQFVGAIYKPLVVNWVTDGPAVGSPPGRAPQPLIDAGHGGTATLSVIFKGVSGRRFAGTGTFNITDAPNGRFTYTFALADLTNPDDYQVQFKATFPDATFVYSDIFAIEVLAPI